MSFTIMIQNKRTPFRNCDVSGKVMEVILEIKREAVLLLGHPVWVVLTSAPWRSAEN